MSVFKNDPARAPPHLWETPNQAWERVHIDFAEPFKGKMWLIIIDALSKWPETIPMTSTDSNKQSFKLLMNLVVPKKLGELLYKKICKLL